MSGKPDRHRLSIITTNPPELLRRLPPALSLLYPPDGIPNYPQEKFLEDLVEESATDIRGCREVLKAGETGLLVPVRNPDRLREAIEILASDPRRCTEMGIQGRQHIVKEFEQSQVLERLATFYRGIENELCSRPSR